MKILASVLNGMHMYINIFSNLHDAKKVSFLYGIFGAYSTIRFKRRIF